MGVGFHFTFTGRVRVRVRVGVRVWVWVWVDYIEMEPWRVQLLLLELVQFNFFFKVDFHLVNYVGKIDKKLLNCLVILNNLNNYS